MLVVLDVPTSAGRLREQLADWTEGEVSATLEKLLAARLVLSDGKGYLSLVLREGTGELATWQRGGLLKRITNQRPTEATV